MRLPPRTTSATRAAAATALLGVLATAGCATGTTTDDPATPEAYDVPGVPVTITVPAGWSPGTQDGTSFVRAAAEEDSSSAFRANVSVTGEPTTASLEDEAADTLDYLDGLGGWTPDAAGQGPTTVGDVPAYRLSGTVDVDGEPVAQEIVLVGSSVGDDAWVVHLTASAAVDDEEGAAQAADVLASAVVEPAVRPAG
ncbi:DUF1795 domain-containing protein [Cellulosimicrobium marinum]|uniref:DUF1795 domain-containing protein n=1 Tax=Cellulosimicrobium marinum TaxID=1638992 RepID=UPI001E3A60DD|nr:DUF1795 domain-containing protein [Cellulosimicrobium marinum]MCB7136893.1 DUF1795 domain-containing protein [Cellulosimicrobium marinum]